MLIVAVQPLYLHCKFTAVVLPLAKCFSAYYQVATQKEAAKLPLNNSCK